MKFGYARVSKNERPQLNALLGKLRKGDSLCVVRLDRLGRRMMKLIELINDFKSKGIEFISLENNIDTSTSDHLIPMNLSCP